MNKQLKRALTFTTSLLQIQFSVYSVAIEMHKSESENVNSSEKNVTGCHLLINCSNYDKL